MPTKPVMIWLFLLGTTAFETSIVTRSWSVRISQYDCNYSNLAPDGCTEYFYGSSTDLLTSYNFAGGTHLADQNQVMCIRREKGNCKICYSTTDFSTDFGISGKATGKFLYNSVCCGYGSKGTKTSARDCILVDGLENTKGIPLVTGTKGYNGGICGAAGLGSTGAIALASITAKTLCTKTQPFKLTFNTDSYEFKLEVKSGGSPAAYPGDLGFKLAYIQSSTC